jgi:hypothetical protein
MKPHSAAVLALAALLLLPIAQLSADDTTGGAAAAPTAPSAPTTPPEGPAMDEAQASPFLPGEQLLGLSAGFHLPAFLEPVNGAGASNLSLGGSFSFSYQYFALRSFAVGGNIAGAFNGTIGGSTVFVAPLGATASYWWTKLPFEVSVLGEAGAYLMRYNNNGIIDPFLKAGGGAYWRAAASWSLGLQAYFWFVPELHYGNFGNLNQYGGFIETSIAAIYHL